MQPNSVVNSFSPLRKLRGVALVLVLSFLVVISGLVIAFFSMVTSEASSAGNAAASASAKALADSAVSFVMGTIVDATQGHDPADASKAGPANAWVWASQPGMIRTYDNGGTPQYVYKLYSADDMRLKTGATLPTEKQAGLSGWATGAKRDVWVDMNEPLKDAAGFDIYPIVDPTAADDFVDNKFPGHKDRNSDHRVAGFHVLDNDQDSNAPIADSRNNNPAPMPVKWLYVLQDGTMSTADVGSGGAVLNVKKASKDNPIKGRVAFWTDDECSKVNINTASQGTYWDTPHVYSPEDAGTLVSGTITPSGPTVAIAGLAITQPTKGEFQRYAGHPATTSLSPILGYTAKQGTKVTGGGKPVLPVPSYELGAPLTYDIESNTIEKYYSLTPRILGTGSYGGTKIPNDTLPSSKPGTAASTQLRQGPYWRLYASLDELLFNPVDPLYPPSGATFSDTIHRVPNVLDPNLSTGTTERSLITPDMMQKSGFFLTATSRAPEVTAYNTPRVSMWPINDVNKINPMTQVKMQLTAYDQLAKFCATVGNSQGNTNSNLNSTGHAFYFTRYDPRSTKNDFTDPNNGYLYNYLRKLTSLPVPGNHYPGTFERKFGVGPSGISDRDQILTCIYDYIRCINIQDSTPDPNNAGSFPYLYTPVDSIGASNNGSGGTDQDPKAGAGEVVPIQINNSTFGGSGITQGFGRYYTVGSAYLLFFAAHGIHFVTQPPYNIDSPIASLGSQPNPNWLPQNKTTYPVVYSPNNIPNNQPNQGVTDAMGVVFMISFNCPAQGLVGNHPKMNYHVQGLNNLTFTPGPFVSTGGTTAAYQPKAFEGTTSPYRGGAQLPEKDSASGLYPVFPKDGGYNIIATSDVRTWHGRGIGGTASPVMGFARGLFGQPYQTSDNKTQSKQCLTGGTSGPAVEYNYPFFGYTDRIAVPPGNDPKSPTFDFKKTTLFYPTTFKVTQSAPIQVDLYAAQNGTTKDAGGEKVQTILLQFPSATFRMPYSTNNNVGFNAFTYPNTGLPITFDQTNAMATAAYDGSSGGAAGKYAFNSRLGLGDTNAAIGGGTYNFIASTDTVIALEPAGVNYFKQTGSGTTDYPPVVDHTAGDQRMYAALPSVPIGYFQPDWLYGYDSASNPAHDNIVQSDQLIPEFAFSMMREVGTTTGNANQPNNNPPAGPYYGVSGIPGSANSGLWNIGYHIVTNATPTQYPDLPRRVGGAQSAGSSPATAGYVARQDGGPGSWDTGIGLHKDGAYINKPDEGDQSYIEHYPTDPNRPQQYRRPYIDKDDYYQNSGAFFSPNRQVPSSMMLGSIPTGIQRQLPWQTLLFHPPVRGIDKTSNPGTNISPPADHYMADLFWMPVVEPYAISQPFSTAGKINMNYQIQPFTYIHRDTGMRALMTSLKLQAIPGDQKAVTTYKPFDPDDVTQQGFYNVATRFPLNLDDTMTMFGRRFDVDHDLYRSATEVSEVMLIPNDPALQLTGTESYETLSPLMDKYWGDGKTIALPAGVTSHQLTGNNLRNKPYADMYSRLTTKSNVFTVHVRAQALRKVVGTDPNTFVTGQDQVIAEYRGSSIIERYIDANDPALPDFAKLTVNDPTDRTLNIDQYYKFRVVSTKRFSP